MLNRRQFLVYSSASALLLEHAISAQATGSWESGPTLPFPVQEIYPVLHNGGIHLAGGFARINTATAPTSEHRRFDPDKNQWQSMPALPAARHHPNLASANKKLFALGGYTAESSANTWVMQQQTWVYQDNQGWSIAKAAPAVHGESVCLSGIDAIHIIGGREPRGNKNTAWTDHQDTDRHWLYDPTKDQWFDAAPALSKRNSASGAVIDGQLLVVGGRRVNGGNVADTEIYDRQEDRWRTAAPMPQAQGGLAAASLNNKLYAFGGEFFGASGRGVYQEAWRYDPATDQWDNLPPMPTPRHGLGAVTVNEKIYVIGGATQPGGNGTSATVEILTDPSSSV